MTTTQPEITQVDYNPGPWTCFHCAETFTDKRCARLHFGRSEDSTPACVIKGADGGLLRALRFAEEAADDAMQAMHAESTDAARAYHAQRCRHTQALIAAEESGYEKGLADGRASAAPLVEALEKLILAVGRGRMRVKPGCGAGGQTTDANVRGSVFDGVDGGALMEAADALAQFRGEVG